MMPEVFRRRRRVSSSGVALIVSDSFNRADNATSLGTADSGQTWTALASTWGISSNQAYNPGGAANAPAVVDAVKSDCTIQVTVATLAGETGIAFRASDASNFWMFVIGPTDYQVWKQVAGVFTNLVTAANTGSSGAVLKVILAGSNIQVFQSGIQLGSTIIDAALSTNTKHGLVQLSGSSAARWDDFTIA